MRKYALMASSVVASEDFLSMSYVAQALYIQILCETETNGEVVNLARVVRSTGMSPDTLDELYSHGYLLSVAGKTVVRHQWVNNKYTTKAWGSMDSLEPYIDGLLEFEGVEGKSPYRLSDTGETPKAHPVDTKNFTSSNIGDAEVDSNSNSNDKDNGNCTGISNGTDNFNGIEEMQGEWESEGRGNDLSLEGNPCWCKRCSNTHAKYTISENNQTTIHCPSCGSYVYDPMEKSTYDMTKHGAF